MTIWQTHHKALVLAAIFCSVSSVCWAEKLDEVVRDAVASNPEILMRTANKCVQANKLRESVGGYLPTVDLTASYGREYNKNYFTRLESPLDGELTLGTREAGVSVKQMIFDGFKVHSEVEESKALDKSSGYQVKAKLQDVIIQVSGSYIDTIMLRSIYMHAKDSMSYYQQVIDELNGGRIPHVTDGDLDYAQSRLSLAQTEILNLQRDIRNAQADYLKLVGKKPGVMYRPESPDKELPGTEDALVAMAQKNHPLVFAADSDIQAARATKRIAKSNYFPKVGVELYGLNGKNLDGINQTVNTLGLALQIKYNLFNGGKDMAHERKASWMLEEKKEEYNQTMRLVEQNARHVWSGFINYKGQLMYLKQRVDLMQQTRDAYHKEFVNGERELVDLLTAAEELYMAKANYVTAQYKELFSRFMILQSMGKIQEYFNVSTPQGVEEKSSKWYSGF